MSTFKHNTKNCGYSKPNFNLIYMHTWVRIKTQGYHESLHSTMITHFAISDIKMMLGIIEILLDRQVFISLLFNCDEMFGSVHMCKKVFLIEGC